jgi:hypothetical protein
MPDASKPYIKRGGVPVTFKGRRYTLGWHEGQRVLANRQMYASYYLVPDPDSPEYHFTVHSFKTGKRVGWFACYMVRVYKDRPTPKRPWWHEPT